MLLYAGVLGAWGADDAAMIKDLLRQQMRHSFLDHDGSLRELTSCPAFVALAPPEVIDTDALGLGPGANHSSNQVVRAIMPVLRDEFPYARQISPPRSKKSNTSWRCCNTTGTKRAEPSVMPDGAGQLSTAAS